MYSEERSGTAWSTLHIADDFRPGFWHGGRCNIPPEYYSYPLAKCKYFHSHLLVVFVDVFSFM